MGFFDEIGVAMMDEHKSLPSAILSTLSSRLRMEKGIEKMQGKIVEVQLQPSRVSWSPEGHPDHA